MSRSFAEIAEEVAQLSEGDQFKLVGVILDGTQVQSRLPSKPLTEDEIKRRIAAFDAGGVKATPFADTLRTVDERLKSCK